MQIKVRKINPDGQVRLETSGEIKEILINEDFLYPNKESVSICFRGKNSSGIVDLTPMEIEHIYSVFIKKKHLVKGIKKMVFRKE
ncbi:MAG: hypothetical protein KKA64_00765 [Nanoarchaeota archaeon]|nr:hypothetical protein [Nanoarchaeota archaeon]